MVTPKPDAWDTKLQRGLELHGLCEPQQPQCTKVLRELEPLTAEAQEDNTRRSPLGWA